MDNTYKNAFDFKDPLNNPTNPQQVTNEKPLTREALFTQIRITTCQQRSWAKIASANKALEEMDRKLAEQVAIKEAGQKPDDALQQQNAELKKHSAPSPWQTQSNRRGKRK